MPRLRGGLQAWFDLPLMFKGMIVISIPLVSILLSLVALRVLQSQRDDVQQRIVRAWQIGTRIQSINGVLAEAQDGVRGYLLTRDESYLQPYRTAAKEFDQRLTRLREFIQDYPHQVKRLDRIGSEGRELLQLLESLAAQPASSTLTDRIERGRSSLRTARSRLRRAESGMNGP